MKKGYAITQPKDRPSATKMTLARANAPTKRPKYGPEPARPTITLPHLKWMEAANKEEAE